MTTATIQKNYKRLENRLENLERIVERLATDELTAQEITKLEKVSGALDRGAGKRFYSRQELLRYLKSL